MQKLPCWSHSALESWESCPPGPSGLLSALEAGMRWGIKKVLETSPPRTQQHLVTCSGRGLHNAALATCCCCVSVDTKLSCFSDLWQFRRQLLALFVSVIKVYSGKSIQKIVVFSYPIKCCLSSKNKCLRSSHATNPSGSFTPPDCYWSRPGSKGNSQGPWS